MTSIQIDRTDGLSSSVAIKGPCRVATTANITLSGTQTIDGVAVVAGDRVLAKDQSTGSENGIWLVDTGPWRRAKDFSRTKDVVTGTVVIVHSGTVNARRSYQVTTLGAISVGTTSIDFVEYLQLADPDLTAIAALTSAANKVPYFTGSGTAALADFTSVGRALVASTSVADIRNQLDATLYVSTRTALKALDTAKDTVVLLTESGREGVFVWLVGDYTTQFAADGFEGIYIKSDGNLITEGCWVRIVTNNIFHMDWFGARGAADILAIFDKAKLLAAGGTLKFGAATYATSDTLGYEAVSNKPLTIEGVSEDDTIISMAGTGFAIEYYGTTGGGNEARGGGVFNLAIAKSGGGSCSGVDIANVYRGAVRHVSTSACGVDAIGIRVTGRGAGDTDATFGTIIQQNRCRDGLIGIQIRGDTSGALVAAQMVISDNNCDGSRSCGIWVSQCDGVEISRNTLAVCGCDNTVNQRGGIYFEYFGIHSRNIQVKANEFGNGTTGAVYDVMIDALIGGVFLHNRHIRNTGEFGTGGYLIGHTGTATSITDIVFIHDFFNVEDASGFIAYHVGGSSKTYSGIEVLSPIYNVYAPTTRYGDITILAKVEENGRPLAGSKTFDPPSIANGASTNTTVTVTGALVGDMAEVSFTTNLAGLSLTGYVNTTDTVTAVFSNATGSAVDLASGTLRAWVKKAG